jgi:hypothetical protein
MIRPDLKGRGIDHGLDILEEKFVLENASRKNDRIDLVCATERGNSGKKALRNSSLKGPCALARMASPEAIVREIRQ